jgi:hypothetical protein
MVLKFLNSDGFVVKEAILGLLEDVANVGDTSDYWSSCNVVEANRGTHGIHVSGQMAAVNVKRWTT